MQGQAGKSFSMCIVVEGNYVEYPVLEVLIRVVCRRVLDQIENL